MAIWNVGPKNGMWRGGRLISSHGYVLLLVGTEHHLADIRGYAYEHRIVAEKVLGRKLRPGEKAHHINGNKQDNRPENIQVVVGNKGHFVYHRKRKDLRLPGQKNPIIGCACGCGDTFPVFDKWGRPRKFISGHNGRKERKTNANEY